MTEEKNKTHPQIPELTTAQFKQARRHAVQFAYAMDLNQHAQFIEADFKAFCTQISIGSDLEPLVRIFAIHMAENWNFINKVIEKHAHKWKLSRIARVDAAILRVCSAELQIRPEISREIIFADAAEIGKEISSEGAGSFIHGVLDGIARELRGEPKTSG